MARQNKAFRNNLERAKRLHRDGNELAAKVLYEKLLKAHPDSPDLLHFYGLFCFQQGKSAQGIRYIERCLELTPDYPDAANNLGNLFKMQGRFDDAERMYRAVMDLHPGFYDAMVNLGAMERSRKNYTEAERWYRQAIATRPDDSLAYDNFVRLLAIIPGRVSDALGILEESVRKAQRSDQQRNVYFALKAQLFHTLKDRESALEVYDEWIKAFPSSKYALHMQAAASGENIPAKSDPDYVRDLFDQFSDSFDEVLDRLNYQAPQLIADAVQRVHDSQSVALAVLDAGCGTGLCGEKLRPYAKYLTGVDISSGMLARARAASWYDSLVNADIVEYLRSHELQFDLLVSSDTLNYFGDLQELFDVACRSLTMGAHMVFTLEMHEEDSVDDYHLNIHGRYSHSKAYVDQVLSAAGLNLIGIDDVVLRKQLGKSVEGIVVTVQRLPDDSSG